MKELMHEVQRLQSLRESDQKLIRQLKTRISSLEDQVSRLEVRQVDSCAVSDRNGHQLQKMLETVGTVRAELALIVAEGAKMRTSLESLACSNHRLMEEVSLQHEHTRGLVHISGSFGFF